jgi:cyclic 2,3-diphosphoglycerate synthetase
MSKTGSRKKALAIIDGHHYLHVLRAALQHAEQAMGYSIVGALLLGPLRKLTSPESLTRLEIPVVTGSDDFAASVRENCTTFKPDVLLDLSGEPALDWETRLEIAQAALDCGVSYVGPDFAYHPVPQPDLPACPALGVLGLGKLVGKTAVCAFAARELAASGMKPVIITMGRGGPVQLQLIRGDLSELTPGFLMGQEKLGLHAASDNYEEALLTRLPVVGCFRAGGGVAGSPFCSTVAQGAEAANHLECDIHLYEGSGNTVPPVRLDARLLVAGASLPLSFLDRPFGAMAVTQAEMIIVTGCEEPVAGPDRVAELLARLHSINPEAVLSTAVLRPRPLGSLEGKKVVYATTAPPDIIDRLAAHLEQSHGCRIAGTTAALSDRKRLKEELAALLTRDDGPEVLLTELKAASVQVALPMALDAGLEVVFCDNVPQAAEPRGGDLKNDMANLARLATERYEAAHTENTENQA